MKLSNATAVIRPRNPWEAIDLGFRMVQRDFWALAGRWAVATFPWVLLVIGIGYATDNIGIALFVFWWFKPAFDRVILEFLSQRLFSHEVAPTSLWQLCVKTPLSYSSWRYLSYLRFSPIRSYALPIFQLEGQNSSNLSSRLQTILSRDYGAASWLTIILAIVTICAQSALIIFFNDFFGPQTEYAGAEEFFESLLLDETLGTNLNFFVKLIIFYVVHSIIEFYFVAAGFALYLNRRTHLEAWDIELSFRRLSQRLSKAAKIVLLFSLVGISYSPPVFAQEETAATPAPIATERTVEEARQHSRDQVTQIHDGDDFGEHLKGERWKLKDQGSQPDEGEPLEFDFNTPGSLVKVIALVLKIIIALTILALVFTWIKRNKHLLFGEKQKIEEATEDRVVEDEPIVKEFKPNPNVPEEVLSLWHQGKTRESLSYLYRSSLSYLTTVHQLVIDESDTEYDCLQLVREKAHQSVFGYFEQVTDLWRRLAYGKITPHLDQLQHLCDDWSKLAAPVAVSVSEIHE